MVSGFTLVPKAPLHYNVFRACAVERDSGRKFAPFALGERGGRPSKIKDISPEQFVLLPLGLVLSVLQVGQHTPMATTIDRTSLPHTPNGDERRPYEPATHLQWLPLLTTRTCHTPLKIRAAHPATALLMPSPTSVQTQPSDTKQYPSLTNRRQIR